jgi:uncharacterized membrane protein
MSLDRIEPRSSLLTHEGAILGGLILVIGLLLLPDLGPIGSPGSTVRLEHARITNLGPVDPAVGLGAATVLVLDGPNAGSSLDADIEVTESQDGPLYALGDEVVVQVSTTPDGVLASVSDRWRVPLLAALLAGFGALVVVVGGWRGIRALIALGLTIAVVLKVVLPLLLAGWPPIPLAVVVGSGVMVVTLALTEGLTRTTFAAILGTFGALVLTAVLAAAVTALAGFSQFQASEEAVYLRSLVGTDFDVGGILLAAIILGALGVLDDVTITQAATVAELADVDAAASRPVLIARAMNVGRAHIAATINTLVLAYVSASLPLLLLFAVGGQSATTISSTELVAVEIVRTLVGSIGIVAAVPFTTAIAAWLARPHRGIDAG